MSSAPPFVVTARRTLLILMLAATAACSREPKRTTTPVARARPAPQPPKTLDAPAPKPSRVPPIERDLDAIRQKGEISVLFTFNSTGYFIYRGLPMGYEYELLEQFAKENSLRLHPVVMRDSSALFTALDRGDGDVIAAQLVADPSSQIAVTDSLYETAPVVVQNSGALPATGLTPTVKKAVAREDALHTSKEVTIRARVISKPSELAGQPVYLPRSSPYHERLLELNEELTNDIDIVEVDESSDHLIQRLAEGDIRFTVAAENVAALRTGEYSNLIIRPALGPPEPVVWGLRTNAPQLLATLNTWIAKKRSAGMLRLLYRKYFLDRRGFEERVASRYLTAETGQLSPYDDAFREYAAIPGWDWRLVAAQAYQESKFNPAAHSWVGAVGLMQLMPRTARELRVKNARDPKQSIEGGCRYLWKLDDQLKDEISNEGERVKFILASYNVGLGHVEDARRLATKYGDDANNWNDVAYWLIRKSKRSVYNDPVVKYGFARGTEPVAYVDLILDRFQHYKEFVKKEPEVVVPAAVP